MSCGLFSTFCCQKYLVRLKLLMNGFKFLVRMISRKLFNNFTRLAVNLKSYCFSYCELIHLITRETFLLVGAPTISSPEVEVRC